MGDRSFTPASTVGDVRFLLAPKWLTFHVVIVAAVVSFVVLGSWQFDAFQESDARHDLRGRDPVKLSEVAEVGVPIGEAADRPVTVAGRYLAAEQRLVPGRVHDGVLGKYIVTPIEFEPGSIVFVVRGWVNNADDPAVAVPSGSATVTGHLLPPETLDHATVREGEEVGPSEVAYVAPDRLAAATGIDEDAQIAGYVLASAQDPVAAESPSLLDVDVVAPIRDVNPWQNLSYWAQWWVFAAAAIVFWFSAVRSAVRKRRRTASHDHDDELSPSEEATARSSPDVGLA